MISVERILQYSNLASEAPLVIENSTPSSTWPETGTISFQNLQVKTLSHSLDKTRLNYDVCNNAAGYHPIVIDVKDARQLKQL